MGRVVALNSHDERLETASRWIVRMDKGLSAEEEAVLHEWMRADPKNAEVILSMTKNWDEMDDLGRLAEIFPTRHTNRNRRRRVAWTGGLATAAVLVVVAAVLWLPFSGPGATDPALSASVPMIYETTIGEQATAILADGSIVVLNTNSRLGVAYSDQIRILRLERGEIHVEVAQDTERPFSVVAGDHVLQALGTAFSVQIIQDQQIELVVTEGRVIVSVHTGSSDPTPTIQQLSQSSGNVVAAGEEIVLGAPNESITPVSAEEIEVKLAWREGRLVFRGETLEEALAEVERYTTVEFVFLEQKLKTQVVTGRFRAGDVDSLLAALRLNFDIVAERADDGRVLLSSL